MNRVFKTIWNRVEQRWVVASETAKSSRSGQRQTSKTSQSSGTVVRFTPQALALCVVGLMGLQSASAALFSYSGQTTDGVFYQLGVDTPLQLNDNIDQLVVGTQSVAIGVNASATGNDSIAIGTDSSASGESSSAIGFKNTASGNNSSAVGLANSANGEYSLASGTFNTTHGFFSSAVGYQNQANSVSSSAVGYQNQANSSDSSAVGSQNQAGGFRSSAFGFANKATNLGSSALGYANEATGISSSALGYANTASGLESTAIGHQSQANATGSTAIGYQTVADREYTLSVGRVGSERQITNVAAGTAETDAVNVRQLNLALSGFGSASTHYVSVHPGTDSLPEREYNNYNNDGAIGFRSVAIGVGAYAEGDQGTAIGSGRVVVLMK